MKKEKAFTLVELLVVIAIIGILASILLPTLAKAKQKVNAMMGAGNKKQLQAGWTDYATDHDGEYVGNQPTGWTYYHSWDQSGIGGREFKGTWCPHGPGYLRNFGQGYGTLPDGKTTDKIKPSPGDLFNIGQPTLWAYGVVEKVGPEIEDHQEITYQQKIYDSTQVLKPNLAGQTVDGWNYDQKGRAWKMETQKSPYPKTPLYWDTPNNVSRIRGKLFMHAELGSYIDEPKVFLSPGENVTAGGRAISRSVAMNCNVGMNEEYSKFFHRTTVWNLPKGGQWDTKANGRGISLPRNSNGQPSGYRWQFFQQNTNEGLVNNPSDLFVFIDQNMGANPSPVFKTPIDMADFASNQNWQKAQGWFDMPARINGGRYSLGFADGHVEQKINTTDKLNQQPDEQAWLYLTTVGSTVGSAGGNVGVGEF